MIILMAAGKFRRYLYFYLPLARQQENGLLLVVANLLKSCTFAKHSCPRRGTTTKTIAKTVYKSARKTVTDFVYLNSTKTSTTTITVLVPGRNHRRQAQLVKDDPELSKRGAKQVVKEAARYEPEVVEQEMLAGENSHSLFARHVCPVCPAGASILSKNNGNKPAVPCCKGKNPFLANSRLFEKGSDPLPWLLPGPKTVTRHKTVTKTRTLKVHKTMTKSSVVVQTKTVSTTVSVRNLIGRIYSGLPCFFVRSVASLFKAKKSLLFNYNQPTLTQPVLTTILPIFLLATNLLF